MHSIVMPDSPMEAKFLKGDDKLIAIERLRANQMGVASRVWKWEHLLESFLDMKTWFWFAMIFSISCVFLNTHQRVNALRMSY
jgi:hypothetical protein